MRRGRGGGALWPGLEYSPFLPFGSRLPFWSPPGLLTFFGRGGEAGATGETRECHNFPGFPLAVPAGIQRLTGPSHRACGCQGDGSANPAEVSD